MTTGFTKWSVICVEQPSLGICRTVVACYYHPPSSQFVGSKLQKLRKFKVSFPLERVLDSDVAYEELL